MDGVGLGFRDDTNRGLLGAREACRDVAGTSDTSSLPFDVGVSAFGAFVFFTFSDSESESDSVSESSCNAFAAFANEAKKFEGVALNVGMLASFGGGARDFGSSSSESESSVTARFANCAIKLVLPTLNLGGAGSEDGVSVEVALGLSCPVLGEVDVLEASKSLKRRCITSAVLDAEPRVGLVACSFLDFLGEGVASLSAFLLVTGVLDTVPLTLGSDDVLEDLNGDATGAVVKLWGASAFLLVISATFSLYARRTSEKSSTPFCLVK